MNCRTCKFAHWNKTKAGRRHPGGDGRCTAPVKIQTMPKAFYWVGGNEPKPSGGFINWHTAEKFSGCQRWMDNIITHIVV